MRVMNVNPSVPKFSAQTFKGLWGNEKLIRSESFDTYEVYETHNRYLKLYHPFADETEEEIKNAIKDKEYDWNNGSPCGSQSYPSLYEKHHVAVGENLKYTKKEYEDSLAISSMLHDAQVALRSKMHKMGLNEYQPYDYNYKFLTDAHKTLIKAMGVLYDMSQDILKNINENNLKILK